MPAKRVKYAQFEDPDAVLKEGNANPSTEENEAGPVIANVSGMVYTLSQSIMVGEEPIYEDTNFLKLSEFNFRTFDLLGTRKVVAVAEERKFDFEWVSGQAVIARKGLPKGEWLKFPVADEGSWEKVEKCIKLWMEQDRKEIKVKWTVMYRKKASTNVIDLEDLDGDGKKVFNFAITLILGGQRAHRKVAV